jgi:hypothetical protein
MSGVIPPLRYIAWWLALGELYRFFTFRGVWQWSVTPCRLVRLSRHFKGSQFLHLKRQWQPGLFDPEDEGGMILRNVGNHSPNGRAPYPRRFASSAVPLREPQISLLWQCLIRYSRMLDVRWVMLYIQWVLFWSVVLEEDGDQLNRSCEVWKGVTWSQVGEE